MKTRQRTAIATAFILIVALAGTACGERAREALQEAASEAQQKLREEPINLSPDGADSKVELTPGGDLLIDGEPVPMDASQREAALAYRAKFLAVAEAGLVVGQLGASFGGDAAALALGALLGREDLDAGETRTRMEAGAEEISTAALALCRQARALQAEQERLAEILPQFAPYAKNIDISPDCAEADG